MEVGAMEESVTVSGEAPLINTASPEQRINLDTLEVQTLPAANRNLTNLLNIGTGLTRQEGTVEGGGSGSGGAGGIRLRLNGLGGAAMSISANGTDASANAGSRQISLYNGISKIDIVSIEAVGEVQIIKGISPAEFGQAWPAISTSSLRPARTPGTGACSTATKGRDWSPNRFF